MLEHGGRLRAAAQHHAIPLADWLDLSTGINPDGWPVPPLPATVWQRLPEEDDGLEAAAAAYYGNAGLLPVAGSQAAIQTLPLLLPRAVVACLTPIYEEHPQAWLRAGHKVRQLPTLARALAAATPYVLLCNPNNPTGVHYSRDELLAAAAQLQKRGGWLIVDEAFVDATPADSVTAFAGSETAPNLIVFRSPGKFFGLAGIRLGFLFAATSLRQRLPELLGPWTVSHPARAVGRLALADQAWQAQARTQLLAASQRLAALLAPAAKYGRRPCSAPLSTPQAGALYDHLARHGILVRAFADKPLLRFGLPGDEAGWQRLSTALADWQPPATGESA